MNNFKANSIRIWGWMKNKYENARKNSVDKM